MTSPAPEEFIKLHDVTERRTWSGWPINDEQCQAVWPARVDADLKIRRLRLIELLPSIDVNHRSWFLNLTLDYVLISNLMVYYNLYGPDNFRDLLNTGVCDNAWIFNQCAKEISAVTKRSNASVTDKQRLAELNVLAGYQQLPYYDFDMEKEVQKLAESGNTHGVTPESWDTTFDRHLDQLMSTVYPNANQPIVGLLNFIKSGSWITAGSSSIGNVEWSIGEDKNHFKARKNMLLDIYSAEQIYSQVMSWNGVLQSKAIVKNEPGKIRVAVASNLEAYLSEAYLLQLSGKNYRAYAGITLDQSPKQQAVMAEEINKLLSQGCHALPFDFASFDHQPTTREVTSIMTRYYALGKLNCSTQYQAEWELIRSKSVHSYSHSQMSYMVDGKLKQVQVTGGLPTGVRVTSLIGNIWNAVITNIATEVATEMLGYDPVKYKAIRGDDTIIITALATEAYFVRLGYAAINAIGNNAKFSILKGQAEFLRTSYDGQSARGWPIRGIISVTQRKPWNAEPWTPGSEVTTIADNIRLVERRSGIDIPKVHHANRVQWSKHTRQSYHWLDLPTRLGGFGIYTFKGFVPNTQMPRFRPPSFQFHNLRQKTLAEYHSRQKYTWINKPEYVSNIQKASLEAMIATDDIPGTGRHYQRSWLHEFRLRKVEWRKTDLEGYHLRSAASLNQFCNVNSQWPWPHKKPMVDLTSNTPDFPKLDEFLEEYSVVSRYNQIPSLGTLLRQHYSSQFSVIAEFEKNGWHRTDAINFVLGETPIEFNTTVNSTLLSFVKQAVENCGVRYWKGRIAIATNLTTATHLADVAVFKSPLNRLFQY
jgi:hypothetical protein